MGGKGSGRKIGSSGDRSFGDAGGVSTYNRRGVVSESYKRWNGMIHRVYSGRDSCYNTAWVCDAWLNYGAFKDWHDCHYREGFSLDKDILSRFYGVEPHYSPETCSYIPHSLNCKITNKTGGRYPRGVSFSKRHLCFKAQLMIKGKRVTKMFNTVEEAYNFFKYHHELEIYKLAGDLYKSDQISELVFTALMSYTLEEYVWEEAHDGATE